ncbi:MAG: DUF4126 domain-containing protein [Candidatus Zixiibacteriota bacterium]|nr:MAG: DUF4126 domain-containing protein [candidate division Zixibacteria bacterium]
MDIALSLIAGICLAAATGFRVFVPLLGMSIAVLAGWMTPSPGFEWVGSGPALIAFATATAVEIGAYYIPWLDNALDAVTTPLAVAAGVMAAAALIGDTSPLLKWVLAIIAGGGVSGIVQGGTVALRAASTGGTGGLTNPLISTLELTGAVIITILAIALPVLGLALVVWICYRMIAFMGKAPPFRKRST